MIELLDTLPDINVQPAEYKRLLGFPREYVMSGKVRERAEWARTWYATHAKPWVYAREADSVRIENSSIVLNGVSFTSSALLKMFEEADADGAILVAVSAGHEVEAEAANLWDQEKPDEYFFLEIYGSAIVEHLVTTTGARLFAWAEPRGLAVLPHYSPGYPDWDISEQAKLLDLVRQTDQYPLPAQIDVMESGMLRPKKSLLALFGLTHQTQKVRKLTDVIPCENCSFAACEFRRAPYRRAAEYVQVESVAIANDQSEPEQQPIAPAPPALDENAKYCIHPRALQRWASERLTLTHHDDGTIDALFRFEGTTCTNMGRAILFHYHVKLGPREQGYPIKEEQCGPAPEDTGHKYMCRYMNNAEHLMVAIDHEKPLLGQRLNDVLSWQRPVSNAGCYCEPNSRKHKWGLVLETIHYALVESERKKSQASATVI